MSKDLYNFSLRDDRKLVVFLLFPCVVNSADLQALTVSYLSEVNHRNTNLFFTLLSPSLQITPPTVDYNTGYTTILNALNYSS